MWHLFFVGVIQMGKTKLQCTPKRKTELWGYLDDDCVEISFQKKTIVLDIIESYIWACCDGYAEVNDIIHSLVNNSNGKYTLRKAEPGVLRVLELWKDEGLVILDYDSLNSASEYDDSCVYDIETNIKHPIEILLLSAPSPSPMTHMLEVVSNAADPTGIGYLSSFLKSHGYSVGMMNLWHQQLNPKTIMDIINKYNPKIIGISSMTENFENGIRISQIVKDFRKDIVIVLGGPHVTFEDEKIAQINHKSVDVIVRGEGEYTLLELANYFLNHTGDISRIDGITYWQDGKVVRTRNRALINDLDALPFPDRIDINKDIGVGVQTSRGCPGQCIFCVAKGLSGGKYRMRSAENVVSEIEYLLSKGVNFIFFQDDTLTVDLKRLNAIIDSIEEKELKFTWSAESRVDAIVKQPYIVKRMANAGCISLQFGIESGSQAMLNALKKNITIEQINCAVDIVLREGIELACSFLVGHPFETPDTMLKTYEFAKRLTEMGVLPVLSAVCPFPGTHIYENPLLYEIEIESYRYPNYNSMSPVMNIKALTSKEIKKYLYKYTMELKNDYFRRVEHKRVVQLYTEAAMKKAL